MTANMTPFRSFGYQDLEHQEISSQECQNAEIPGIVTWSVETLHHRNAKMPKCEMPKYRGS
jgi:hypothetical protein